MKNFKSRFYSTIIVLSSVSVVGAAISCLGGVCFDCKLFSNKKLHRLYIHLQYVDLFIFENLYLGYGGRILEWGLTVVISILMLISNMLMLIFTVIPICFSNQRNANNVWNLDKKYWKLLIIYSNNLFISNVRLKTIHHRHETLFIRHPESIIQRVLTG